MIARIRCLIRRHHDPLRHPLGGFRCRDCGVLGLDLGEMGFEDEGYVTPSRRPFTRFAEDGRPLRDRQAW